VISVLSASARPIRGDAEFAAPSPDGKQIAFVSSKEQPMIMVAGANGEDARSVFTLDAGQLGATPSGSRIGLSWSPDARRIAFARYDRAQSRLSIEAVEVATGKTTEIIVDPGIRALTWSPDARILFAKEHESAASDETDLYSIEVDPATGRPGGEAQKITDAVGFQLAHLSVTADAARLAVVKESRQSDVYMGDLSGGAFRPQRFTLDERNDAPSGWTSDSATLLFHSERNGTADIFRQASTSPAPEQFVLNPDHQVGARVAPGGNDVLYWSFAGRPNLARGGMKLKRIGIEGGPPYDVLEAPAGSAFRCPRSGSCVLAEPQGNAVRFSALDPESGRGAELLRIEQPRPEWDLAPDGNSIAVLDRRSKNIRVHPLGGGTARVVVASEMPGGAGDFAFDATGRGFFLAANSSRGNVVASIEMDGRVKTLWEERTSLLGGLTPSPDGKRLAFSITVRNANAWLIEKF
jgi:Tol biopolymer transport system component